MIRHFLSALVALSAIPAAAQDASNGLSFGGEVKLEYLDSGSGIWAFDGDVGMTWRSGGLLGFDASLDTTYLDDSSGSADFTNAWAALVLSTGAGEFAVGAPRPLLETQGVMPKFSSSRAVDLETTFLRGPITPLSSTQDNGVTPGITWTQQSGNLTYGAGYHHLNDGSNVDIAEGIMRYQSGATTLFISGEYADTSGPNLTILQIGGLYSADRFDAGLAFTQLDSSDTIHTLRLYGAFDVMPSLTVRGDALLVQNSSDVYSLSATYNMPNGVFVEGGGTKIDSSQEVYDLGVGFKF
jgi:hypothetical protein